MKVTGKRTTKRWNTFFLASFLLGLPTASWACCPSDGQTSPKAATGLGDANPPSADLAVDPLWEVYEFERDGIRYVQINDAGGSVRAAVGRIANTFWVMPIGTDADRVAVPGKTMPSGIPKVIYRGRDIEVVLYEDGTRSRWLIRTSPSY